MSYPWRCRSDVRRAFSLRRLYMQPQLRLRCECRIQNSTLVVLILSTSSSSGKKKKDSKLNNIK